ncbi:competence protein ComK [Bacillus sp. B1-b2]|uniref:competence protein ComK n=1 Tax=Bacillus sp. B1-b2 TaxID=2653201 RepID=UPI0012624961|nr:competence protein ComK [Bacillus sp. B1-b2]KAB7665377.1 transcriptional regulator [Bacillus sp. B1-b2]
MDQYNWIDTFEINYYTLAIVPIVMKDNLIYSKIYQDKEIYLCKLSPLMIIKRSCDYFCCSYEGRREGTRKLMNYNHKLPIIIDESNSVYFFPTHSPNNVDCVWISFHNILDIKETEDLKVAITFRNLQQLNIDVSLHTINNQLMRTNALKTVQQYNIEASKNSKMIYKKGSDKRKKLAENQVTYSRKKDLE